MSNATFNERVLTFKPKFNEYIAYYAGVFTTWIDNDGYLFIKMSNGDITNLGPISEYYYAKDQGYEGSLEDWAALVYEGILTNRLSYDSNNQLLTNTIDGHIYNIANLAPVNNPHMTGNATVDGSPIITEASRGVPNGVAGLDNGGKVPASQLPSYVDDVEEYSDFAHFPVVGETGKIYVALDTNKTYRWSGSTYIEISNATDVLDDTAGDGNVSKTWTADKLSGLLSRIEDLEYVPISINSLSVSPSLAEIGSTQTSATLTYGMNRNAVQMKLDNNVISNTSASGTISLTGLSLTSNKTWTLKAKDERDREASKNVTLTFTNKVKYGAAVSSTINDAFLNSLPTRTLSTGKIKNINVTTGENQYIWYALPSSYGTCTFTVGGFTGGFSLISTFNHTNESGTTVEYRVYRSDNPNLGAQAVTIT